MGDGVTTIALITGEADDGPEFDEGLEVGVEVEGAELAEELPAPVGLREAPAELDRVSPEMELPVPLPHPQPQIARVMSEIRRRTGECFGWRRVERRGRCV